jgi:ABC-type glycerol-3-phosphate transport system permease component
MSQGTSNVTSNVTSNPTGTGIATATRTNPSLEYRPTPQRGPRSLLAEKLFLYGLFTVVALVFIVPYLFLVTGAFKTKQEIFTPGQLLPSTLNLQNFKAAYDTTVIVRAFLNSTVIAVTHVSLSLFLCSLAGYAFAKFRGAPGNGVLFAVVLGTMMIPGAVTTIPVFVILNELNLMNTFWVMILPGAANAFGIFWMRQYISTNVPDDLMAAARIDGCGEFRIYWQIVLPVIKPALAALGILVLIGTWNNLMWAFIALRTENMYTLPLVIYLLQGEQRTDYGMLMACGLLATLPLVIAFLLFQRSFIQGMTAGAVKA